MTEWSRRRTTVSYREQIHIQSASAGRSLKFSFPLLTVTPQLPHMWPVLCLVSSGSLMLQLDGFPTGHGVEVQLLVLLSELKTGVTLSPPPEFRVCQHGNTTWLLSTLQKESGELVRHLHHWGPHRKPVSRAVMSLGSGSGQAEVRPRSGL